MNRREMEGETKEHQAHPWQKIITPPEEEVDIESGYRAWTRKYLDLADLLMRRVQRRWQRTSLRRRGNYRDAA